MKGTLKSIYRFLNPKFQTLFSDYKVDFKPRYGHGKPAHPELKDYIDKNREEYKSILNAALKYKENLSTIKDFSDEADSNRPVWNNGFLPGLDIVMIYTFMAKYAPSRYLEVGSGNSTKVANKAKIEKGLNTEIISIDPQPRVEIDILADRVIRSSCVIASIRSSMD